MGGRGVVVEDSQTGTRAIGNGVQLGKTVGRRTNENAGRRPTSKAGVWK